MKPFATPKQPKKDNKKPQAKSGKVKKTFNGLPVYEVVDGEITSITIWFKRRD